MKKTEKLDIFALLHLLWKKKFVIVTAMVAVVVGGIIFTQYILTGQSTIQIGYQQVTEADYKIHRNLYVAGFFSSLYELDRAITRQTDEGVIDSILAGIDALPQEVSVARSGRIVRISVRSKEVAEHAQLLEKGLSAYTAAVDRYRSERSGEIIDGILECIDYDILYRQGEIEHLEKYREQQDELYRETFSEERTRLYIQLSQLDYARDEMLGLKDKLPDILNRYELQYVNRVQYAASTPLSRTKIIVFAVAGLFAGAILVIIADFVRAGIDARRQQS
ncbi:MAG TPA: hypothetical protein PKN71_03600 [Bacillota bacterium]|nr:hypothetical protein [Bacillota bacterium]HPZ21857.1 hypothetical protein [Bacillota bacterium]